MEEPLLRLLFLRARAGGSRRLRGRPAGCSSARLLQAVGEWRARVPGRGRLLLPMRLLPRLRGSPAAGRSGLRAACIVAGFCCCRCLAWPSLPAAAPNLLLAAALPSLAAVMGSWGCPHRSSSSTAAAAEREGAQRQQVTLCQSLCGIGGLLQPAVLSYTGELRSRIILALVCSRHGVGRTRVTIATYLITERAQAPPPLPFSPSSTS